MNNNHEDPFSETIWEITKDRYDKEFERWQHIDGKAGTQIGFSGIIISIVAIAFSNYGIEQIKQIEILQLFVIGIGFLLLSIAIGIAALTKFKKTIPIISPEKLYDKYGKSPEEEQKKQLMLAYFDLIYEFETTNGRDAKLLYAGNVATLVGLVISFISLVFIFKVFG